MPQRGELALRVLRYILPITASLPDPTLLNHSSDLWSKRGKKFWSHPGCVQRPFSICRGRLSWKMHLLMKCIPMSCLKQLRLLHLKEHFTLHCNYHSWRGSMLDSWDESRRERKSCHYLYVSMHMWEAVDLSFHLSPFFCNDFCRFLPSKATQYQAKLWKGLSIHSNRYLRNGITCAFNELLCRAFKKDNHTS